MTVDRVRALREDFDRSFSLPHQEGRRDLENYIAVRVSGDAYLMRLEDIGALAARRTVVPVPSRRPEFLGMTGHRGAPVALFSLAMLLGYGRAAALPRWFIVLRGAGGLGLGFDEYQGHVPVAGSDVCPVGEGARRPFVTRAAGTGGVVRPIVDLPGVLATLKQ